ncbi:hypothetical protein ANAEL_05662 [Anaerolineales bacterium]|nr:hypothetical protein ANAEL_05662 [Anaerolineales bacterium]
MKKIFLPLVFLFALLLAACSGTAAPAPTSGDVYVSQNLPTDYDGALAVRNQLAFGTLELNQGDLAISAEQAQALIPLWQGLRSTQQAGGSAQAEVSALLTQIESAMTPEQLQAIAAMKLTQPDMQAWATANGITMGSGTPGQGAGMSPEARATKQAAEGVTTSGGSGSKLSAALIDAVIASLEAQVK